MTAGVLTASGVQTLQRRICPVSLCETTPAVCACSVQHARVTALKRNLRQALTIRRRAAIGEYNRRWQGPGL